MAQKHIAELYSSYLDGTLSESQRIRCEAHLQACASCTQGLAEMRLLLTHIGELPEVTVPDGLVAAIQQQRPANIPAQRFWRAPIFAGSALAAAAVLLLVMIRVSAPVIDSDVAKTRAVSPEIAMPLPVPGAQPSTETDDAAGAQSPTTSPLRIASVPNVAEAPALSNRVVPQIKEEFTGFNDVATGEVVEFSSAPVKDATGRLEESIIAIDGQTLKGAAPGYRGVNVPTSDNYRFAQRPDHSLETSRTPMTLMDVHPIVGMPPAAPPGSAGPGGAEILPFPTHAGAAMLGIDAGSRNMDLSGKPMQEPTGCGAADALAFLTPPPVLATGWAVPNRTYAVPSKSPWHAPSQRFDDQRVMSKRAQPLSLGQLDIAIAEHQAGEAGRQYVVRLRVNGNVRDCLFLRYAYPPFGTVKSYRLPEKNNEAEITLPGEATVSALAFSFSGQIRLDSFYLVMPPGGQDTKAFDDVAAGDSMVGILLQISRDRGVFILSPAAFAERLVERASPEINPMSQLAAIAKEAGYLLRRENRLITITPESDAE